MTYEEALALAGVVNHHVPPKGGPVNLSVYIPETGSLATGLNSDILEFLWQKLRENTQNPQEFQKYYEALDIFIRQLYQIMTKKEALVLAGCHQMGVYTQGPDGAPAYMFYCKPEDGATQTYINKSIFRSLWDKMSNCSEEEFLKYYEALKIIIYE